MSKLARGKLLASGAAARQRRSKGRDAAWKKKFSSRVRWVNDKLRSILKCHVRLKLYLFFPPAFTVQSVHIYVVLSPTHKTAACLMTATGGFVSRHAVCCPHKQHSLQSSSKSTSKEVLCERVCRHIFMSKHPVIWWHISVLACFTRCLLASKTFYKSLSMAFQFLSFCQFKMFLKNLVVYLI